MSQMMFSSNCQLLSFYLSLSMITHSAMWIRAALRQLVNSDFQRSIQSFLNIGMLIEFLQLNLHKWSVSSPELYPIALQSPKQGTCILKLPLFYSFKFTPGSNIFKLLNHYLGPKSTLNANPRLVLPGFPHIYPGLNVLSCSVSRPAALATFCLCLCVWQSDHKELWVSS